MENKKVFIVENDFAYHGDEDVVIKVFNNEKAARDYATLLVNEFRNNDHLADSETAVIEEDTEKHDDAIYSFCAYEDGEYSEDHLNISILELPVCNNASEVLGI